MLKLYDLTRPYAQEDANFRTNLIEVPIKSEKTSYTGMTYRWETYSMNGSYIDFPGHIKETDDGIRAETADPAQFWRIPCSVIRLDRASGTGGVTAEDLEKAFGGRPATEGIILNALGTKEPHDIENRTVWLTHDALDWLIACGMKCLVSDIYESRGLHGVFQKLFKAGITAVCEPYHLASLKADQVLLSIVFLPVPGVTQLPCRILAEEMD